MTTVAVSYATPAALTIGLASLASSSTFLAGRESDQVDNTSNLYDDALLQGFISVGTSPTASTQILVYVWGSHTSLVTTARDALDGADSAETLTSAGVRDGFLKLAAIITVDSTTSNVKYEFGPCSVAALFGGVMPQFWGVFVAHSSAAGLNATAGNHEVKYTGVKYTVN